MLIRKEFNYKTYAMDTSLYPVDNYYNGTIKKIITQLLQYSSDYHMIQVPLLGQNNGKWGGKWCARTSASMIYNYHVLATGMDTKENYIRHSCDGHEGWVKDLRHGGTGNTAGFRAFYSEPDKNKNPTVDSTALYNVRGRLTSVENGMELMYSGPKHLFRNGDDIKITDRIKEAQEIRNNPDLLNARYAVIINSLQNNNPVLMYTGLSIAYYGDGRHKDSNHIVLITGYIYIGKSLWLLIADPEVVGGKRVAAGIYKYPEKLPENWNPDSPEYSSYDTILLHAGDWDRTLASLYLFRADHFFDKHPKTWQTNPNKQLLMDDCGNADAFGGQYFYSLKKFDCPEELLISSKLNSFSFPFSEGKSSPLKYYQNNEDPTNGTGGFYCMGLVRNVHGGIHLFAEDKNKTVPVRTMAPGYIVAMRLPPEKEIAAATLGHINNWTGFILVRHDITIKNGDSTSQKHFYSMYMHLLPPDYEKVLTGSDPCCGVPWFMDLFKKQHGAYIKISNDEKNPSPIGTIVWAKKRFLQTKPGETVDVFDDKGQITPIAADKTVQWFFKAPPLDNIAVIENLKNGKIVTFTEPLLLLQKAGEIAGISGPKSNSCLIDKNQKENLFTFKDNDGKKIVPPIDTPFIHWEAFSPVVNNESTFKDIIDLVRSSIPELAEMFTDDNVVSETTQDNFLDVAEMQEKIIPRLPADDQKLLKPSMDKVKEKERLGKGYFSYASDVIKLFTQDLSFAPASENLASGEASSGVFTYPVTLQIEAGDLFSPDRLSDGNTYKIEVAFYAKNNDLIGKGADSATGNADTNNKDRLIGTSIITIDAGTYKSHCKTEKSNNNTLQIFECKFRVPASTDYIVLKGAENIELVYSTKETNTSDLAVVKELFKYRWRSSRLRHLSEFSPLAISKLVSALKKRKIFPDDFDENQLLKTAWWNDDLVMQAQRRLISAGDWISSPFKNDIKQVYAIAYPPDEESIVPEASAVKTLFGDGNNQLPKDCVIDNVHPVTLNILLNLLRKFEKIDIATPSRSIYCEEADPPVAWGWQSENGTDGSIGVMVVDDDFGYDPDVKITITASSSDNKQMTIARDVPYQAGGVFIATTKLDFWGSWTLNVKGAALTPQYSIGQTTITIPAPSFQNPSREEIELGLYAPVKSKKTVVWPVKVKDVPDTKNIVLGFIGVEISTNGTSWSDVVVDKKKPYIAATAQFTKNLDSIKINSTLFKIDGEWIYDVSNEGHLAKTLKLSDNVTLAEIVKASGSFRITCSLAQALHTMGCKTFDIVYVSADGKSCIIKNKGKNNFYKTVKKFIDSGLFEHISITGEESLLTADVVAQIEQPAQKETKKKLVNRGIKVIVRQPLKTQSECADLLKDNLITTANGKIIVGIRNNASQITSDLNIQSIRSGALPLINIQLIKALESLYKESKKNGLLKRIEPDGISALFDSRKTSGLDLSSFAKITTIDEGKSTLLKVLAAKAAVIEFDSSPLLSLVRRELIGNGVLSESNKSIFYRYYFCAVNGFSKPDVGGGKENEIGMGFQENLKPLSSEKPHILRIAAQSSCGTIKYAGFSDLTYEMIENSINIKVVLHGNSALWENVTVSAKVKFSNATDFETPVNCKINSASKFAIVSVPLKSAHKNVSFTGNMELILSVTTDFEDNITGLSKNYMLDITPKITGPLNTITMRNYLILWCKTNGIAAPGSGKHNLAFLRSAIDTGTVISGIQNSKTMGSLFELSVTANGKKSELTVQYYIGDDSGTGGFCNHEGILAARIPIASLDKGTSYNVTFKRKNDKPVRSLSVAPLSRTLLF